MLLGHCPDCGEPGAIYSTELNALQTTDCYFYSAGTQRQQLSAHRTAAQCGH